MLDEGFFGGDVVVEGAVAVEVVGGDHGDDGDVGRPVCLLKIFEHEAGELEDDLVIGLDIGELEEEGAADVAADVGGISGLEHRAQESGGGGFSLGAGDAGDGGWAALDEEADFGGDGDFVLAGDLEKAGLGRDGGRGNDEVGVCEVGVAVAAEVKFDGQVFKLGFGFAQGFFGGFVGDEDVCALLGQPAGDGDSAAESAEADDGDVFSGE